MILFISPSFDKNLFFVCTTMKKYQDAQKVCRQLQLQGYGILQTQKYGNLVQLLHIVTRILTAKWVSAPE
jgi:hypothetical protein